MISPEFHHEETKKGQIALSLKEIYDGMSNKSFFTRETLNGESIDKICQTLESLKKTAEETNDQTLAEVLNRLNLNFFQLNTIGIVDHPEKFTDKAATAFELLETVLLLMDKQISEEVLKNIIAERTRQ
ncbi:hypothetical protein GYA13_00110 [Candidatus Kuenenbacteria bacterium]|nr:hypothetical protein [Candidatus Kuenenbacteria bacterium]